MDDQIFDDSIKSRVGDYEEREFDLSALSALHRQMADVSPESWYSRYKTELTVGAGLALSAIIIVGSLWFINNRYQAIGAADKLELEAQREHIAQLEKEVSLLKTLSGDTIRVVEIRRESSTLFSPLFYRIASLEASLAKLNETRGTNAAAEFSGTQLDSSMLLKPLTRDDGDVTKYTPQRLTPQEQDKLNAHARPGTHGSLGHLSARAFSVKTIHKMENHYQKGIGIRLGPTLELSRGIYPHGTGPTEIAAGVLGDLIFSPSLSLEAGVKYAHRFYEISRKDKLSGMKLPGVDEGLGVLKQADIDSWVFEIPITLKYRYPVSLKTHWIAGIGYSPMLYTKQNFEYYYAVESNPLVSVNFKYKMNGLQAFTGTLNFSLGLSQQLKNKKLLETSIYYRQSVGGLGAEKTNVAFFGVRSVYWFTVR